MKLAKKTLFSTINITPVQLNKNKGYVEIINRHITDSSVRKCIYEWIKCRYNIPLSCKNLDNYLKLLSEFSIDEQLYLMNQAINRKTASLKKVIDIYIGQRKNADNISE